MDEQLSRKIQLWCAYSGIAYCVLYGISFIILPVNYPPPDPAFTAQELVDNYYLKYQSRIMLGHVLNAASGILYLTWGTQLTVQMWRREPLPILSLLQLGGAILTTWVVMFPPAMWVWCAENAATADPETIKMVHFIAWYLFDITYWVTTLECIAIFLIVLYDKEKPALLPKWVGWFSLFAGLSFIPLTVVPYFKDGIFALNGYWNFHGVFIFFGAFTGVASYYMGVDIKRVRIPAVPSIGQALSRNQRQ
nr:hypothetical protein [uncultured Cohaesibacter sp.]